MTKIFGLTILTQEEVDIIKVPLTSRLRHDWEWRAKQAREVLQ